MGMGMGMAWQLGNVIGKLVCATCPASTVSRRAARRRNNLTPSIQRLLTTEARLSFGWGLPFFPNLSLSLSCAPRHVETTTLRCGKLTCYLEAYHTATNNTRVRPSWRTSSFSARTMSDPISTRRPFISLRALALSWSAPQHLQIKHQANSTPVPDQHRPHSNRKHRLWTSATLLWSSSRHRNRTTIRQGMVCCQRDTAGYDHISR